MWKGSKYDYDVLYEMHKTSLKIYIEKLINKYIKILEM